MTNEEVLLKMLKAQGSMGKKAVMDATGWTEAEFEAIKESLLAQGLVAIGRGRGGSLKLAEPNGLEAAEPMGLFADGPMAEPKPYPMLKRGRGRPSKDTGIEANGSATSELKTKKPTDSKPTREMQITVRS